MKSILSKKGFALIMLVVLFSANAMAITAVASGDWSNSATWGGTAPGNNVSLADIDIPSGITVTLDQDVSFNGLVNSFMVNGTLSSTSTNSLMINQGSLSGSGLIEINKLVFNGILASSAFTGIITVNVLENNASVISFAAVVNVEDSLLLRGGSMAMATGSNLTLETNSFVIMNGGNLTTSGGVFNAGNNYSVRYEGASQTSGLELNSSNLQNLYVSLDDSTNTLTLANNLTVNSTLHLNSGLLIINGVKLTLNGDVKRMSGSKISSNQSSNIVLEGNTSSTDGLWFSNGSSVNDLTINLQLRKQAILKNNLMIAGNLNLMDGSLAIENGAVLTMANNSLIQVDNGRILLNSGSINATGVYHVAYIDRADSTGVELNSTGLSNLSVNLSSQNNELKLMNDAQVAGLMDLAKGRFSLNGNDLVLNGTFNQTSVSGFVGHSNSALEMNLTSSVNDSMFFTQTGSTLRDLTINITGGTTIVLASFLQIDNDLDLMNGKIDIGNYNLRIGNSGSINGFTDNNYIVTSGSGKLQMNVNTATPHVVFPVGTSTSYSPASIQQTSSGTSGVFMVSAMDGVYSEGTTGVNNAISKSVVNRTWLVEAESGVNVNMNLKLGWKATSEMNSFKRGRAFITHYTNSNWDNYARSSAIAGLHNTFEIERKNISSLSPFAVADSTSVLKIETTSATANVISLFPNPATDEVQVSVLNSDDDYVYEIFDMSGKVVMTSAKQGGTYVFPITGLGNGFYYITATNFHTGEMVVRQFIKY